MVPSLEQQSRLCGTPGKLADWMDPGSGSHDCRIFGKYSSQLRIQGAAAYRRLRLFLGSRARLPKLLRAADGSIHAAGERRFMCQHHRKPDFV